MLGFHFFLKYDELISALHNFCSQIKKNNQIDQEIIAFAWLCKFNPTINLKKRKN